MGKRKKGMWISGYPDGDIFIQEGTGIKNPGGNRKMCISDYVDKGVWIMVINIICKPVEKSKCEKCV